MFQPSYWKCSLKFKFCKWFNCIFTYLTCPFGYMKEEIQVSSSKIAAFVFLGLKFTSFILVLCVYDVNSKLCFIWCLINYFLSFGLLFFLGLYGYFFTVHSVQYVLTFDLLAFLFVLVDTGWYGVPVRRYAKLHYLRWISMLLFQLIYKRKY